MEDYKYCLESWWSSDVLTVFSLFTSQIEMPQNYQSKGQKCSIGALELLILWSLQPPRMPLGMSNIKVKNNKMLAILMKMLTEILWCSKVLLIR